MCAKDLIKKLLYGAGYYHLKRRLRTSGEKRLVVLMYHNLVEDGPVAKEGRDLEDHPTRSQFAAHLCELAANYRVITLRQAVAEIRSGGLESDAVAITFDDGCAAVYGIAFPLLKRHRLSATVFPATGWINGEMTFWSHRLGAMVRGAEFTGVTEEALSRVLGEETRLPKVESVGMIRRWFFARASQYIRSLDDTDIDTALDRLEALLSPSGDVSPGDDVPLNWDQIREMSAAGIEFAAHTRNHVNLSRASDVVAEREIAESKREIEERLQCDVSGFAYTYGKDLAAYTRLEPILKKLEFEYACSACPGYNSNSSNLYSLRRVCLPLTTSRALIGRALAVCFTRPNTP